MVKFFPIWILPIILNIQKCVYSGTYVIVWVPVLRYMYFFADPIQNLAQEHFSSVVALYRAAHSAVCYSVHQATTDLLENMPLQLGLSSMYS